MTSRSAAGSILAIALVLGTAMPLHADPDVWRREGWSKTDFTKRSIRWEEITSGGPPKDGIPAIDSPKFKPADEEHSIHAQEAVIGLAINGDARAYPIRVLIWHEIVNDTVGGVPVAVTYCPLCNAALVYERDTQVGLLTFGTTGRQLPEEGPRQYLLRTLGAGGYASPKPASLSAYPSRPFSGRCMSLD